MSLNKIKTIAVFTSSRSEYGTLLPLLKKINKKFNLHLLVGGSHLLEQYGKSINEIIKDGFKIHKKFSFLFVDNSPDVISRSLSELLKVSGKYFSEDKPDLLVLIGDRIELIAIASAALIHNIPIAHLSGGEVTEGAVDNQVRNAVSKMAHLHFPTTERHKKNLLRMGEEEWRVCTVGEPALDLISSLKKINKEKLYKELNLKRNTPVILATFHPQTIDGDIIPQFIKTLFSYLTSKKKYQILVTASNFDKGGPEINQMLEELSVKNNSIIYKKNLGQERYYSLLRYVTLMLGNSSSGIWEAQSFNLPVINVGNRQQGRIANPNVYNVDIDINKINNAIKFVLSDNFKRKYFNKPNLYGNGNASEKIIKILKNLPEKNLLLKKNTY